MTTRYRWIVNEGDARTEPLDDVLNAYSDMGYEIFALLPIVEDGRTTITIVAREPLAEDGSLLHPRGP